MIFEREMLNVDFVDEFLVTCMSKLMIDLCLGSVNLAKYMVVAWKLGME